jgi:HlyD family secretion protein
MTMLQILERTWAAWRDTKSRVLDAAEGLPRRLRDRPVAWIMAGLLVTLAAGATYLVLLQRSEGRLPEGFAMSNGRLEADRVDVATKLPGRLKEVLVKEGDTVDVGQVLARMDTAELEAQLHEAQASVNQAERQLDQAVALVAQRQSELTFADQELRRTLALVGKGVSSRELEDQRRSARNTAEAVLNSANAQVALAKATIDAAKAKVAQIKVNIDDAMLTAPRTGRIQYRLALPGEVLAAGGKVVTLLDLGEVYMTVFLPTKEAGRLSLGEEARLVFDAAPQYVVPGYISFVAADAQFTPKFVETKDEREKLMFRAKVQVSREVLAAYPGLVKAGVPGVAYVKVSRQAVWPKKLQVKLP